MKGRLSIVITGSAGFIGFHLAKRLLEEDHSIIGIDNLNDYYDVSLKEARNNILHQYPKYTFYKVSLEEAPKINSIFENKKVDVVVHLAAQAGVRYSHTDPHAYINSNIVGFINILEASRQSKIKHLIYASSSSVYGANKKMPFSVHDSVDHPVSLYAATKKSNELMAHTYAACFGLPVTGLRFFTVYGPWGRPDMALFLFTKAILEARPIDIYNNGDMKRDFTYIDDIVESISRLLLASPKVTIQNDSLPLSSSTSFAPYQLFNIGSNNPTRLMEYISILELELGRIAQKNFLPIQIGDVKDTFADVDELINKINFQPKTDLKEGIATFVRWYKDFYKTES